MAERINVNPHFEVIPDHAGPHYGIICATLTQNGLTEEQAVQALNDLWSQAHNEWIQRWEQQTINDANAAEEAQRVLNTVTKVIYHTSLLIDCVILLLVSRCTTPGT